MPPKNKLDLAVHAHRLLSQRSFASGRVRGELPPENFANIVADLEVADLLTDQDPDNCIVEFLAPYAMNAFFATSMDDLLTHSQRRQVAPGRFYLADEDYIYERGCVEPPEVILRYLDAIKFISLLIPLADYYVEKGKPKLVFLNGDKVEVYLEYCATDLGALSGLSNFISEYIHTETHVEQKATIIKAVLLEMSSEISDELTIGLIFSRFEEFSRRVSSSYQLYVSEFSFQKIKAEVEKSKFEAVAKINKVFSDIQNQLLAIPVALVIVCGQMEIVNSFSIKNFFILVGAFVFSLFMFFLVMNQKNTLKTIFFEINSEWDLIRGKHKAIKLKFDEPYRLLRKRYIYQFVLLESIGGVVCASFSITMAMYFYSSSMGASFSAELAWPAIMFFVYVLCRGVFVFCDSSIRKNG